MTKTDRILIATMKTGGIVLPSATLTAFEYHGPDSKTGFSLAACCAMLDMESYGGLNIWGHDPWNSRAYPKGAAHPASPLLKDYVTAANYKAYKASRNAGMQPQGCGSTQLTSPSYQEEAEKLGGCWKPVHNRTVGFHVLGELFAEFDGALGGFGAYNGSGAGGTYAHSAVSLMAGWQARFDHALA